ncbi:MAG: adaptor protein MecA [Oscillospiraceae bacterium]|jgi:negative regulator of genetic competence, sporulation and motility
MTIQQINPASIAVYLSPEDLADHGCFAEDLTIQEAFRITRLACGKLGFSPTGILEIEAFPNACGVLVFAKLHEQHRALFRFPDLETLLSAISVLPRPFPDASLTYWEDAYHLSFIAPNPSYHSILLEFGQSIQESEYHLSHILEHGRCIVEKNALDVLDASFFPQNAQ